MQYDQSGRISSRLQMALNESEVKEARWEKVRTAKYRFVAQKIIKICLEEAHQKALRIDVLIWDTMDERHVIIGRDDIKNFENMYIQLFKNVFRCRWPINRTWLVYFDQNSSVDWSRIRNILANTNRFANCEPNILPDGWEGVTIHFGIQGINEGNSEDFQLIQAADIFAGMGRFSYENIDIYKAWERQNSSQPVLFDYESIKCFSRSMQERSQVMYYFLDQARKFGLGITLDCGLCTKDPSNPINFWLYRPQHSYDKAPTR